MYSITKILYKDIEINISNSECEQIIKALESSKENNGVIKSYNKYQVVLNPKDTTEQTKTILLYGGYKYFLFEKKLYKSEDTVLPNSVIQKLFAKEPKSIL